MTDTELIVDLRGRLCETVNDFWDTVSEPCGLPMWFGREPGRVVGHHRDPWNL